MLRPEEMFECVFTCGADCKGTSLYPCLQIFVNNSESNSVALLHFDEQQLVLNPKVRTDQSQTDMDQGGRTNLTLVVKQVNQALKQETSSDQKPKEEAEAVIGGYFSFHASSVSLTGFVLQLREEETEIDLLRHESPFKPSTL